MVLSISGVILLGALVILLTRKSGLKVSHAIVCALFGFYLAGTSIAPNIREGGNTVASIISGLHL
jgi:hypothetical protein